MNSARLIADPIAGDGIVRAHKQIGKFGDERF